MRGTADRGKKTGGPAYGAGHLCCVTGRQEGGEQRLMRYAKMPARAILLPKSDPASLSPSATRPH